MSFDFLILFLMKCHIHAFCLDVITKLWLTEMIRSFTYTENGELYFWPAPKILWLRRAIWRMVFGFRLPIFTLWSNKFLITDQNAANFTSNNDFMLWQMSLWVGKRQRKRVEKRKIEIGTPCTKKLFHFPCHFFLSHVTIYRSRSIIEFTLTKRIWWQATTLLDDYQQ